jgi:hypothetical protein
MASAGRILIMPKGEWKAETTYEMLDLVFHGGASWLAKKEVIGIEPSDANSEHWFKMCESADLTSVYNRLQAIESQLLSSISLDDIDLTPYAKAEDLAVTNENVGRIDTRLSGIEESIGSLTSSVKGIASSGLKIATGSYTGNGYSGSDSPNSLSFDFEPKVVFLQDVSAEFSCPVIWHKGVTILTLGLNGSNQTKQLQFSLNGNTLQWYYPLQESDTQLNESGKVYHWVALG